MNLRCPYCGLKQSPLLVLLGATRRRQSCVSCNRVYIYRAPKEMPLPFIDLDVAIIGLVITVFVKNWLAWAVIIAGLVVVLYLRHIVLASEPGEESTK